MNAQKVSFSPQSTQRSLPGTKTLAVAKKNQEKTLTGGRLFINF
jgi:hypothetical protein